MKNYILKDWSSCIIDKQVNNEVWAQFSTQVLENAKKQFMKQIYDKAFLAVFGKVSDIIHYKIQYKVDEQIRSQFS